MPEKTNILRLSIYRPSSFNRARVHTIQDRARDLVRTDFGGRSNVDIPRIHGIQEPKLVVIHRPEVL